MTPELALRLVPVLEAYCTLDELRELCGMFDVSLTSLDDFPPRWVTIARELTENLGLSSTRRLLDALLDLIDRRNEDGIAHSKWEPQAFHQGMASAIRTVREMMVGDVAPSEIAVSAGAIFTAKSLVRELLETAKTPILIVDPYIGVGTLDCLRAVDQPVSILTSTHQNAIEPGFESAFRAIASEGRSITVRRGDQLHDRHIAFNERCWLVGGSLKDAGRKPFHCMEIVDQRKVVVNDLEARWAMGAPYPLLRV